MLAAAIAGAGRCICGRCICGLHSVHFAKLRLPLPHLPSPQGPGAPAKKRRSLLQGLAGAYGEVAMGGSGSHFVEKCYALAVSEWRAARRGQRGWWSGGRGRRVGGWVSGWGYVPACSSAGGCCAEVLSHCSDSAPPLCLGALPQEVAEKETIAGELAAAEPRLLTTHRGPLLLRRCHVDAYKKGSQGWQQRVVAADAARREFEDLFGEAEAGAGAGGVAEGAAAGEDAGQAEESNKAKKAKKAKRVATAAPAAEEGQHQPEGGDQQAGGGEKKSKKKRQQQEAEAAAPDERQEEAQQPAGGSDGGGKAIMPKTKAAEQQGAEAVDDIMAQLGERAHPA